MTINWADFSEGGTEPDWRDKLVIAVSDGNRVERHFLKRSAEIGSRGYDFIGEVFICLRTSLPVRREKLAEVDEAAGLGKGSSPESAYVEVIRDVLIVATLLVKKVAKS